MRVDFHVHTRYSHDSDSKIEEILYYAKQRNLDAIAITDHDSLKGSEEATKIRRSDDVQIIPGVEITVPIGQYGLHLIGLFMYEYNPFPSLQMVIEDIKRQGGVVILPHPFCTGTGLFYHLRERLVSNEDVSFVLNSIDFIEGLNNKGSPEEIKQTFDYIKNTEHILVAGSDSHTPENVGLVWTEINDFKSFRAGNASTKIAMLLNSGWDSQLDSLGNYLVGHKFVRNDKEGTGTFKKIAKQFQNMIPSPTLRLKLQNNYRHFISIKKQGQIQREVRASKPFFIEKTDHSLTFSEEVNDHD